VFFFFPLRLKKLRMKRWNELNWASKRHLYLQLGFIYINSWPKAESWEAGVIAYFAKMFYVQHIIYPRERDNSYVGWKFPAFYQIQMPITVFSSPHLPDAVRKHFVIFKFFFFNLKLLKSHLHPTTWITLLGFWRFLIQYICSYNSYL
jgi:hypothetical protein